ncbi:MAG: hypothetical protein JNL10_15020 [Verrucomicrobiales bacterium]|nr:hypothetical protein [Verrucomicrobiales bacterium]
MRVLFWIFASLDLLLFLGCLGFAVLFAVGSKSNPISVLGLGFGLLVIGCLFVGGPIVLFLRAKSTVGRIIPLFILAAPVILLFLSALLQWMEGDDRPHWDVHGRPLHLKPGNPQNPQNPEPRSTPGSPPATTGPRKPG